MSTGPLSQLVKAFLEEHWPVHQPLITPAHFEAIGRLAVGFNAIEGIIDSFTRWLLETREPDVARSLIRGSFGQKADALGDLIRVLNKKYPAAKPKGDVALDAVKDAKKFAEKRNELIHATPDSFLNKLTYRQSSVDIDLKRIQSLSVQAGMLESSLVKACGDFLVEFKTIRDPNYPKSLEPRRKGKLRRVTSKIR